MPISDSLTPRDMRGRAPNEDALGLDRLARSFLRTLVRQGAGTVAHVQGAPGSGKSEFMRRCMHYVENERDTLGADVAPDLFGVSTWYNPWAYSKQGNLLAGLVATIARTGTNTASQIDRARDIVSQMNRMRFDGTVPESAGSALTPTDADPVDRMRRGLVMLVDQIRQGQRGRLVVFVADLDQLPATVRLAFLDGVRLLVSGGADIAIVVAMGRESAVASVRSREGDISDIAATRILDEMVDFTVTVPKVEIRRIGSLLRRYIGVHEVVVRRAFGDDSLNALTVAASHRQLGIPRFLERLSARILMLSDFTLESRAMRELSEAQWAWVVLSERWPEFRRFMIRGGKDRWLQLKQAVAAMNPEISSRPGAPAEIVDWLRKDPLLADYLRLHADGLDRDNMGVYWVEDMLLQAGL
ncbi:MAG: P-loop NTPase fold protein [Pseudomonadota bacterium]|nr:P-loop NTPase fold protein [Pseudomonadota bacterium]